MQRYGGRRDWSRCKIANPTLVLIAIELNGDTLAAQSRPPPKASDRRSVYAGQSLEPYTVPRLIDVQGVIRDKLAELRLKESFQ